MHTPRLTRALMFALLGITLPVHAGSLVVHDLDLDEGNVVAMLEQTSQHYIDAMHKLVNARYKDEYRAIRWEDLEASMTRARVARLEYRYEVAGQPKLRVYHAMGGEPLGVLGESIFAGPTRPGTPVTPTSPGDLEVDPWDVDVVEAAPAVPQRDLAAIDADDETFFRGFDDIDVRARLLPTEGTALPSFHIDGQDRALDPEMKAMRHIENDIQRKLIPRGGRIDARIGGVLCSSCRQAMQSMANTYDLDIRATQIFQSLPQREQDALVREGKARLQGGRLVGTASGRPLLAHDALLGARAAQVRRSLSPRAMGRSFKGQQWQMRSLFPGSPGASGVPEALPPSSRGTSNPDVDEPGVPTC